MQGVIVTFDPASEVGVVMTDTKEREQYVTADGALDKSIFAIIRQGQRINFDLNDDNKAINIRIGSEVDMGISTARV